MIKNASISALALVIGMALVLGACGSKGDDDVAGATANVTFTSSPNADIWIDGKAGGTTPLTLALSAGSHKIAMKRNGFVEVSQALAVEAGKDITVDGEGRLDWNRKPPTSQVTSTSTATTWPSRPTSSRAGSAGTSVMAMATSAASVSAP